MDTTATDLNDPIGPARTPEVRPPLVPLRRNWRFQVLWGGAAASMIGTCVADLAYPLLLLAMTGSPSLAGSFGAVQSATMVLVGLHSGMVADRHDRRRVLIAADSVRLVATATIPLALALGCLTVVHVLAVGAVLGAAMAYGGTVRQLAIRSVVAPEQLRQALAQDELRVSGSSLIGPPLAGFLLGLGRAVPFLTTALASAFSVSAALAVRFDGRPAGAGPGPRGGAFDGLRYVLRVPLLRSTLAVSLAVNLAGSAALLAILVLLHQRGTSGTGIGSALAGEAVGGLLGAPLVRRLHGRFTPGVLLLAVAWLAVPMLLVPALVAGPVAVFGALLVMMLGVPSLRVMLDVLIFQQVADELRGRVIAATMTVLMLGLPLGNALAGLLLDRLSPAGVLELCAGLLGLGLLPMTLGRPLWRTAWPA